MFLNTRYLLAILALLLAICSYSQQKIGLVLSGGGATALAHVGVLKALEEKGIPIDYITGTSAGALVGSLYAAGYSPEEIEAFMLDDAFLKMSRGEIEPWQRFTYRERVKSASMFEFGVSADSILNKSLPTNFASSRYLDFVMLKELGTVGASVHNDFDSLFVPFRCVASDVSKKESRIFAAGNLNAAVRASMTYPFYIHPITIDGNVYFDGGLYNNFPANVMEKDFSPDFIIGSNVTSNAKPPSNDDLIGQVTNMLMNKTDFSLQGTEGIIIVPETDVTTFEFSDVEKAINQGYISALKYIDSIYQKVDRRITKQELDDKRARFRSKIIPLNVSEIHSKITNKKKKAPYPVKSLIRSKKEKIIPFKRFKRRYYRLYAAEQIDFMYPNVSLKSDSTYKLSASIIKAKEFLVEVGGHFSSRPVNTGYIGLSFRHIGNFASILHANSYFGKFYGSTNVGYSIDIPSVYPVSVEGYFTMNRWDYFRSFATFFEEVRPSFLINNEMYTGLRFKSPIINTAQSIIDGRYFMLEDHYYQVDEFSNTDTTDVTTFQGMIGSWEIEQNTLNRKQFANSGHFASLKFRYVSGREHSISGSTALSPYDYKKYHSWINLKGEIQTFPLDFSIFHLGLNGTAVFNSQSLFSNYTASLLQLTAYAPIPDMNTFFLEEYRSPQYFGLGTNLIFTIRRKLDIRLDGYYYQPFLQLTQNENGTFGYSEPFKGTSLIGSASIIYNSFLGPLRTTINYFPRQDNPLSFQISFGYVIFNDRAVR